MSRALFAVISFLIAVTGCAGIKPTEPPGPPGRVPSSIRAQAVVEIKRLIPVSGRAQVIAKSPSSFRIEVFGPFGQTAALLSSDGETTYLLTEKGIEEFRKGDSDVPYSLAPEDITSLLIGGATAGTQALAGADIRRDEAGRLRSFSKASPGKEYLNVFLDDYRDVSGAHIPFIISIENGKRKIEIKYKAVEVDPEIDDSVFKPGTAAVEEVK